MIINLYISNQENYVFLNLYQHAFYQFQYRHMYHFFYHQKSLYLNKTHLKTLFLIWLCFQIIILIKLYYFCYSKFIDINFTIVIFLNFSLVLFIKGKYPFIFLVLFYYHRCLLIYF